MVTGKIILDMEKQLQQMSNTFRNDQMLTKQRAASRLSGQNFKIEDYIEGLVLSLLTNSRPWSVVRPYVHNGWLKNVFRQYNPDELSKESPEDLVKKITDKKLGNRRITPQMATLKQNIDILCKIEKEGGTIDDYFKKHLKQYPIVSYDEITKFISEYKFREMEMPLTCEFLKNMGFDLPKPDSHLKQFFGKQRMGVSKKDEATPEEIFNQVDAIANSTGKTRQEIDLIVWAYGAAGYGEICSKVPKCNKCVCKHACNF